MTADAAEQAIEDEEQTLAETATLLRSAVPGVGGRWLPDAPLRWPWMKGPRSPRPQHGKRASHNPSRVLTRTSAPVPRLHAGGLDVYSVR